MASICGCFNGRFWTSRRAKNLITDESKLPQINGIAIDNGTSESLSSKSKADQAIVSVKNTDIPFSKTVAPSFDSTEEKTPSSQKALVVISKGQYALLDSYPIPEFEKDNEVMIRNYAVGLNPIDWKSVDYNFCLPTFPWVTGRELAGVVERVAPGVTKWKKGDRVWTSTYYRDVRAGCFQDFVIVPEHTVSSIPKDMTFETAACLGVAALTAGMTLWKWLGVPMLTDKPQMKSMTDLGQDYLLVWGGSTITGQFAIQFAANVGLKVVAVASKKTKSMVQSLGAQVVTRDSKTVAEIVTEISAITGDNITRAIDLVGAKNTINSLKAVSKSRPVAFAPLAMMGSDQVPENVAVHTVEMKKFVLDEESVIYSEALNKMIEADLIKMPEIQILTGGYEDIQKGLDILKGGDMNGKKLVVSMREN